MSRIYVWASLPEAILKQSVSGPHQITREMPRRATNPTDLPRLRPIDGDAPVASVTVEQESMSERMTSTARGPWCTSDLGATTRGPFFSAQCIGRMYPRFPQQSVTYGSGSGESMTRTWQVHQRCPEDFVLDPFFLSFFGSHEKGLAPSFMVAPAGFENTLCGNAPFADTAMAT